MLLEGISCLLAKNSTMEAGFNAASVVVAEMIGIREVMKEMGINCLTPVSLMIGRQLALMQLTREFIKQNMLT